MKTIISYFSMMLLIGSSGSGYASLCTTGQHVGNPHCQQHGSTSGTSSGNTQTGLGTIGQTTDTASQNPQTGSIPPDHHNTQIIPAPHKSKHVKVPTSAPKQVTPQVPQLTPSPPKTAMVPTPTPQKVPLPTPQKTPQPVQSITITGTYKPGPSGRSPVPAVTGTYQRGPSGYSPVPTVTGTYLPGPSGYSPVPTPTTKPGMTPAAIPPKVPIITQKTPHLIPPKAVTGASRPGLSGHSPVQGITSTGQPANTGQIGGGAQPQTMLQDPPTHHFIVVNDHLELPVTSGPHPEGVAYNLEVIEPGIQNKQVAVYRSNDAREVLYQDAIKMDATGFFLIDLGIRDPEYIK